MCMRLNEWENMNALVEMCWTRSKYRPNGKKCDDTIVQDCTFHSNWHGIHRRWCCPILDKFCYVFEYASLLTALLYAFIFLLINDFVGAHKNSFLCPIEQWTAIREKFRRRTQFHRIAPRICSYTDSNLFRLPINTSVRWSWRWCVVCGRDKYSLKMKMRDEQQLLRSQF